jgi:KUP system potassium uptake protein
MNRLVYNKGALNIMAIYAPWSEHNRSYVYVTTITCIPLFYKYTLLVGIKTRFYDHGILKTVQNTSIVKENGELTSKKLSIAGDLLPGRSGLREHGKYRTDVFYCGLILNGILTENRLIYDGFPESGEIDCPLFGGKMRSSKKENLSGIVKALGLVFGDIGTSPIYTFTVIFTMLAPSMDNILGTLSLIVWTLIILVFVEYVFLAMSLGLHGEGGTLILKRILDEKLSKSRQKALIAIVAFTGVSLLLGDGVITPSISILSAVEGINLIPGFETTAQWILILIAIFITVGLFVFQPLGTDKVAGAFGPFMIVWFVVLATTGSISIIHNPVVFKALNPFYAVLFLKNHGIAGFVILSQVILCATGAEALYADMGHLGKKPITRAWNFVFIALVLNYLGQGSFLLSHPEEKNILFAMAKSESLFLYIPFLLLTIAATVIASQALISGVFSIVYQGINTGAFPRMKVSFTSQKLKSQIYINAINFTLMAAVIFMLILFKESSKLAVAYGLAVSGTMCLTGVLMCVIFYRRKQFSRFALGIVVTLVDLTFFLANMNKLHEGGYWSLIIASIPLTTILLWTRGQHKIYQNLRSLDIDTFLPGYTQIYEHGRTIPGIGLFFLGNPRSISPYIIHCIVRSGIIYERNVLFSVKRTDYPYGIETVQNENLGKGLESLEIFAGYREDIDIEKILKAVKMDPKVIFYGVEDIQTKNFIWKFFSIIKKNSPSFVKYYKIPGSKLHGVISRVEM